MGRGAVEEAGFGRCQEEDGDGDCSLPFGHDCLCGGYASDFPIAQGSSGLFFVNNDCIMVLVVSISAKLPLWYTLNLSSQHEEGYVVGEVLQTELALLS